MNQSKDPEPRTESEWKGSHQEVASRGNKQLSLTISRISEARPDIVQSEFGKISNDFLRRHASCQVLQNVLDCDPQPPDTRFSTALVGLNGDDFPIVHGEKVIEVSFTRNSARVPVTEEVSLPACKRNLVQPGEPFHRLGFPRQIARRERLVLLRQRQLLLRALLGETCSWSRAALNAVLLSSAPQLGSELQQIARAGRRFQFEKFLLLFRKGPLKRGFATHLISTAPEPPTQPNLI
jgi:hypothetical protein